MTEDRMNGNKTPRRRRETAPSKREDIRNFESLAPRGPQEVKNQVIGILRERGKDGVVFPDPAFRSTNLGPVSIDRSKLNGAPFGMTVVCEILNPTAESNFRGKIIEVLGEPENGDTRMRSVLHQYGLSPVFPEPVMEEVNPLPLNPEPETVEAEIKNGRHDLRSLTTITIDGEEAKDLDDAITLERMPDGLFHLYVHIADVSNYVKENTLLDREAQLRATSVYLVDRVIPMLPPKLSNGLCSLNPEVDRLTMTCEMFIDENGQFTDGSIYESVIRSDRRMSYNECYRILTEPQDGDDAEYGKIIPMLREMKKLAEILRTMRFAKGALNFDFPETKVQLDDTGKPVDVGAYPINFCHGIIEQCMIAANEFVAKRFCELNYPFVYRVHEDPDRLKITRFCTVARTYGARGTLSGKITPYDVTKYMDSVKDESALPMLNSLLLRSLAKARYSSENLGHFGLASGFYCHFTSPIRRYPDLYIHRIIKSYIHNENQRRHFGGLVEGVASHSSDMEINSVEAERASVDIKVAEYMEPKVGEHYDAVISSIIEVGCFVQLPNTVEGFIPFRSMRDHYVFDDRIMKAIGMHSGRSIVCGFPVRVVLAAVDTSTNKLDFVFEEGFETSELPIAKGYGRGAGRSSSRKERSGKTKKPKTRRVPKKHRR